MYQEYHSLLEDDKKLADEEWFEELDEFVFTLKHRVCNWLKEGKTEQSAKKAYSKKGSKPTSSGSSAADGRNRISAIETYDRESSLIAQSSARSDVYEAVERKESEVDHSETIKGSKVETVIGQQEIMHKHQVKSAAVDDNIQAPTEIISRHYEEDGRAKSQSTIKNTKMTEELSQMMCNLLRHQSAPNVEIETFTGNPLDYHYFMLVFIEAMQCKIDDPHIRLVRLLKHTAEKARETTKHCIQDLLDIEYDTAKLLLEQHCEVPP